MFFMETAVVSTGNVNGIVGGILSGQHEPTEHHWILLEGPKHIAQINFVLVFIVNSIWFVMGLKWKPLKMYIKSIRIKLIMSDRN